MTNMIKEKIEVPVHQKVLISVYEAMALTGLGEHRIRRIIKENPKEKFIVHVGTKWLIKRELFIQFLNERTVV